MSDTPSGASGASGASGGARLADATGSRTPLVLALLLAAGVATALGVLGRSRSDAYAVLPTFGFSDAATFKSWVATAVLVLAFAQMLTAMAVYGRLPWWRPVPRWVGVAHRSGGAVAFVLSVPAAAYCLYGFGFAPEPMSARTLVHSMAGCAFYGAFAAKILLVHTRRLPGWALPVVGGALLSGVVLTWLTSALWWFQLQGVHV